MSAWRKGRRMGWTVAAGDQPGNAECAEFDSLPRSLNLLKMNTEELSQKLTNYLENSSPEDLRNDLKKINSKHKEEFEFYLFKFYKINKDWRFVFIEFIDFFNLYDTSFFVIQWESKIRKIHIKFLER